MSPEPRECRCGSKPKPTDDVDFFIQNGTVFKILNGTVALNENNFSNNPARVRRLKNMISIPAVFDAQRPPALYSIGKTPSYLKGKLTPWEYLQKLKETEESCRDIPLPDALLKSNYNIVPVPY